MRGVLVSLSLFAVACSPSGLPSSPTAVLSSGAPPSVVPRPAGSAAALEITSFRLGTPDIHDGWYAYLPELTLKETTGVGGAEVAAIVYTEPDGTRTGMSGPGCSLPSSVTPGGTWNISSTYLYCQDVNSRAPITSLAVEVHYVDTAGNSKTVSGAVR